MPMVVASVTSTEFTSSMLHVYGTITASGNYSTAGDTLDFSKQDAIKSTSVPVQVEVYSAKTAGPTNLFVYNYSPGTTIANGKCQVFTGAAAQTALTELSAGAYPAGVTGDSIVFHATFPKNL